MSPRDNWYDSKWGNRRALVNREKRRKKYGGEASAQEPVDVPVVEETTAASDGPAALEGLIAELTPPRYSIYCEGTLITGRAESEKQSAIVHGLAIGDRVEFLTDSEQSASLVKVYPRRSRLARLRADASRRSLAGAAEHLLAANVDIAVIVASVVSPNFHPRLVDRYLVMCQYGNVAPVLCLSKIDLAPPPDVSIYESIGLPVVRVSTKNHQGFEDLLSVVDGKCCVLTGHSGVGKSSIINYLLGQEVLAVREVSARGGLGRHTSVSSSLHAIGNSTYLIDTPGIRSLGLWDIDPATLRFYFPEFSNYAERCHYRDCTHTHEPGCAVREAVQAGKIANERYDSYVRMLKTALGQKS